MKINDIVTAFKNRGEYLVNVAVEVDDISSGADKGKHYICTVAGGSDSIRVIVSEKGECTIEVFTNDGTGVIYSYAASIVEAANTLHRWHIIRETVIKPAINNI